MSNNEQDKPSANTDAGESTPPLTPPGDPALEPETSLAVNSASKNLDRSRSGRDE